MHYNTTFQHFVHGTLMPMFIITVINPTSISKNSLHRSNFYLCYDFSSFHLPLAL